jgi:hypothetical protein
MLCDHEIDPSEKGDPRTPPADPGEIDPPHPADDEAVPVVGSSGPTAKKTPGKAAKKPGKKAGKKAAKKNKKKR